MCGDEKIARDAPAYPGQYLQQRRHHPVQSERKSLLSDSDCEENQAGCVEDQDRGSQPRDVRVTEED